MPRHRSLIGLLVSAPLAAGALLTVLAPTSCGSDAVGVDACRSIETARCQTAAACGFTPDKVEACTLFYRDECLHGVENADAGAPSNASVDACVAAVEAAGACKKANVKTIGGCTGAKLVAGADGTLDPCKIIEAKVEALAACAFVVAPGLGDGGAIADASADTGADASDAQ